MKIKRPLINPLYEPDIEEPEELNEPLTPPSFTHIKPLEEASKLEEKPADLKIKEESTKKAVVEPLKPIVQNVIKESPVQDAKAATQTSLQTQLNPFKQLGAILQTNKSKILAPSVEDEESSHKTYSNSNNINEDKKDVKKSINNYIPLGQYNHILNQIEEKKEAVKQVVKKEPSKEILSEPLFEKRAIEAAEIPAPEPKKIKPAQLEKPITIEEDQLQFNITPKKPTLKQRLQFIKLYLDRRQELLEISTLWKNPSLPFNIVSVIFVLGLLFVGGIFEFDRIPLKIPIFYNHVEKSWEQADKSTLFIMGIVVLFTEIALINLIIKIFKSDRRLALTLSWVVTFINVLIIVAALQIYSLIT